MNESNNNSNLYKYVLAAVIAIFTIYVSYTQGSNRIDERIETRVQAASSVYMERSGIHDADIEKRLTRIEEKLDRLQERAGRGR